MSANVAPRFVDVPRVWIGQVTVANGNRDGVTGTYVTLLTAGANGSLVELIRGVATVTTTAGMWRIFIYDGVNSRLYCEIAVSAITGTGTVAEFSAEYTPSRPLVLPATYQLRASTQNAEAANIVISGGDF